MSVEVSEETLPAAAQIHALSWQASHSAFCSPEFVRLHTAARQSEYLQKEMLAGKRLYLLVKDKPVGIVSIKDAQLIENLYVLPTEQNRGYGTELLLFAMGQCTVAPRLWVLDNNHRACALYARHGFRPTGVTHPLSDILAEVEMERAAPAA
mgnify:CR=1 FL=1